MRRILILTVCAAVAGALATFAMPSNNARAIYISPKVTTKVNPPKYFLNPPKSFGRSQGSKDYWYGR